MYGNTFNGKDAIELRKKTMIVGYAEIDSLKVKSLKGEALENYKNRIGEFCSVLKTAVDNYWTITTNVLHMPLSEAEELMEKKPDEFVVLRFCQYNDVLKSKEPDTWITDPHAKPNTIPTRTRIPGHERVVKSNQVVYLSIFTAPGKNAMFKVPTTV